jgi:Flp pilus assembly protein protease CpaA
MATALVLWVISLGGTPGLSYFYAFGVPALIRTKRACFVIRRSSIHAIAGQNYLTSERQGAGEIPYGFAVRCAVAAMPHRPLWNLIWGCAPLGARLTHIGLLSELSQKALQRS